MSWDAYIDNIIAQSKDQAGNAHVDKAMIIGLDGKSWTTTGHANALKPNATEMANIAQCFKSKDFSPFMAGGVHLGGTKYQFLRQEDGKIVLAKKKGEGAVSIQSSKTAVIVAHCPEGCQQGNVNKAIGVIADYLEGQGM